MLKIVTVTDDSSIPKNLMLSFNHYLYIKFTHFPGLAWPDLNYGQVRLAHRVATSSFHQVHKPTLTIWKNLQTVHEHYYA